MIGMDSNYTITKSTPTADELNFLEDRLYEFNSTRTGKDDGHLFAFFVRNEKQEIIAGISGWTWAGACEVRTLWVDPSLRGHGYGQSLLQSAEQEARSRSCKVIMLTSYSFQAPEFYQKHGYTLAWQLSDFPPGHEHCILVKRLS
jgi:GNAT superfamily N-acetyltransferase